MATTKRPKAAQSKRAPGPPRGERSGLGRPAGARERVPVTLLLPEDLRRELRIVKAQDGVEMSEVVEAALRAYLKARGVKS